MTIHSGCCVPLELDGLPAGGALRALAAVLPKLGPWVFTLRTPPGAAEAAGRGSSRGRAGCPRSCVAVHLNPTSFLLQWSPALRKHLDAVAAGGDPEALAAVLLRPVNPKFCVLKPCQALRKELDAVAAGGDLEALAAGDGGLSAGTFGANHDAANEVRRCFRSLLCNGHFGVLDSRLHLWRQPRRRERGSLGLCRLPRVPPHGHLDSPGCCCHAELVHSTFCC
jgi:hypothetical protein